MYDALRRKLGFLLVTGMPGAGKSIVTEMAREKGIPTYCMGDVIRNETIKKYGVITPENMRRTSKELREKYGDDIVARKTLEMIKEKEGIVVVDGVRSLVEVEVFRKAGESVEIIAVHASPKTRFRRILERKRPGDPKTWDEFVKRDMTELSFGIGNVIALADYMIVNEESIEETKKQVLKVFEKVLRNGENIY